LLRQRGCRSRDKESECRCASHRQNLQFILISKLRIAFAEAGWPNCVLRTSLFQLEKLA
jgi:hypothetical protein